MTCEVLFFEIVAVIFLGVTSLLYKEKHMGVINVFGILPSSKYRFILSKVILFTLMNYLFFIVLTFINIDIKDTLNIIIKGSPHVLILSLIMSLLSHISIFVFKDFRQFGFAYAFIIIFSTAPVFLAANTSIKWNWIEYYPIYIIYMKLKNSYFNIIDGGILYYAISLFTIGILFYIVHRLMISELSKE